MKMPQIDLSPWAGMSAASSGFAFSVAADGFADGSAASVLMPGAVAGADSVSENILEFDGMREQCFLLFCQLDVMAFTVSLNLRPRSS